MSIARVKSPEVKLPRWQFLGEPDDTSSLSGLYELFLSSPQKALSVLKNPDIQLMLLHNKFEIDTTASALQQSKLIISGNIAFLKRLYFFNMCAYLVNLQLMNSAKKTAEHKENAQYIHLKILSAESRHKKEFPDFIRQLELDANQRQIERKLRFAQSAAYGKLSSIRLIFLYLKATMTSICGITNNKNYRAIIDGIDKATPFLKIIGAVFYIPNLLIETGCIILNTVYFDSLSQSERASLDEKAQRKLSFRRKREIMLLQLKQSANQIASNIFWITCGMLVLLSVMTPAITTIVFSVGYGLEVMCGAYLSYEKINRINKSVSEIKQKLNDLLKKNKSLEARGLLTWDDINRQTALEQELMALKKEKTYLKKKAAGDIACGILLTASLLIGLASGPAAPLVSASLLLTFTLIHFSWKNYILKPPAHKEFAKRCLLEKQYLAHVSPSVAAGLNKTCRAKKIRDFVTDKMPSIKMKETDKLKCKLH